MDTAAACRQADWVPEPLLDPAIYSNQYEGVDDPDDPRGGHSVPMTWRDLAQQRYIEIQELQAFQQIVVDLDRNENGRHEGDADIGTPGGISRGNPLIRPGEVLGYAVGGRPYVMPPRGRMHDAAAWGPHRRL